MSEAKTFGRLKAIESKVNVIPKLNWPANLYQINFLHLHLASVNLKFLLPGSKFDAGTLCLQLPGGPFVSHYDIVVDVDGPGKEWYEFNE
jgi:hypothetical protein